MPSPYSAPKSQGTSAASNLRRGQVGLKQHKMSHSWNFVTIWSVWWRPWKALLTGLVLIIAWPNLLTEERPSPGLCSDSADCDLNAGWSKHKDGQDLKRKIWGEKCPYGASQAPTCSWRSSQLCSWAGLCAWPERPWKALLSYFWLIPRLCGHWKWRLSHWSCIHWGLLSKGEGIVWGHLRKYLSN